MWEFVSAIVEGRPAVPSFYDGLNAQIVADAVLESYQRAPLDRSSSANIREASRSFVSLSHLANSSNRMIAKVKKLPTRAKSKRPIPGTWPACFPTMPPGKRPSRSGKAEIAGYGKFRGKLGESAETLAKLPEVRHRVRPAGERLGTYAFLKTAEDTANSDYQRMIGRYRNVASRAGQAASYIRPEIMAIPAKTLDEVPGSQAARRRSS